MAIRADAPRVSVTGTPPTVGKRSSEPICCVMAGRACGRDNPGCGGISGHVIRYLAAQVRGTLPRDGVATVAIDRRLGGGDVTKAACRRYVSAGQGETGGVVVEDRIQPIGHVVAGRASGWI